MVNKNISTENKKCICDACLTWDEWYDVAICNVRNAEIITYIFSNISHSISKQISSLQSCHKMISIADEVHECLNTSFKNKHEVQYHEFIIEDILNHIGYAIRLLMSYRFEDNQKCHPIALKMLKYTENNKDLNLRDKAIYASTDEIIFFAQALKSALFYMVVQKEAELVENYDISIQKIQKYFEDDYEDYRRQEFIDMFYETYFLQHLDKKDTIFEAHQDHRADLNASYYCFCQTIDIAIFNREIFS